MIIHSKHKKKGYTLIETLVAITILMIAIAGPLTVANKALTAAVDARNQVMASNLAQEEMEYIKQTIYNEDISRGNTNWNLMTQCVAPAPGVGPCGASMIENGYNIGTFQQNFITCTSLSSCKLYIDANRYGYTYNATGGTATPFTRYFYVTAGTANGAYVDRTITVVVTWNTGTLSNQVTLQSEVANFPR